MTLLAGGDYGEVRTRHRGSYGRYVLSRCLGAVGSLAFMMVVSFFLFRVLPGDPARTLGRGRFTSAEQLEEFNRTYGLDQSLPQQFVTFVKNTLTGDFGVSLRYRVPVSDLIVDRMWPTVLLVGSSTILAVGIGVWMGIRGGWNRGGKFDNTSTGVSLTLYSMPEWWLGLLLIAFFAVGVGPLPGLFPTGGLHSIDSEPGTDRLGARHHVAPDAAGDHADPGLPRRLRPHHAQLVARRAG